MLQNLAVTILHKRSAVLAAKLQASLFLDVVPAVSVIFKKV